VTTDRLDVASTRGRVTTTRRDDERDVAVDDMETRDACALALALACATLASATASGRAHA